MSAQMTITEPNGKPIVEIAPKMLTPMQAMERLMENPNCDPEKLAKFMELHFQYQREEARLAYVTAIQQFKATAPEITRSGVVDYPNRDGSRTTFQHVELHKANKIISESLRAVGITASWRMTSDAAGRTFCTCILTHAMGHVEEVSTLSAPADTSGGKNSVQAIGSTASYLERYTLLAGLGLTPEGMDDDGKGSTGGLSEQTVEDYLETIRQAATVDDLRKAYESAKAAANNLSDASAVTQFVAAKDARYKQIVPTKYPNKAGAR